MTRAETAIEQLNSIIESSKNEIHENRLAKRGVEGEINVINQQIITLKMNDQNIHDQIDRINSQIESGEKELTDYTSQKDELDDLSQKLNRHLKKQPRRKAPDMTSYRGLASRRLRAAFDIIEYMRER